MFSIATLGIMLQGTSIIVMNHETIFFLCLQHTYAHTQPPPRKYNSDCRRDKASAKSTVQYQNVKHTTLPALTHFANLVHLSYKS